MATYNVFKDGEHVNTIVCSKNTIEDFCKSAGYDSYEFRDDEDEQAMNHQITMADIINGTNPELQRKLIDFLQNYPDPQKSE